MYTIEVRQQIQTDFIAYCTNHSLILGLIQIGSAVKGFKDQYSDLDFMVSIQSERQLHQVLSDISTYFTNLGIDYIHTHSFREDAKLLIILLQNKLELNISVLPLHQLIVRSPWWNIVYEKDSLISYKMNIEHTKYLEDEASYQLRKEDLFSFVYYILKARTELKRNNLFYVFNLLNDAREYIVDLEKYNQQLKKHYFKSYNEFTETFQQRLLTTYPIIQDPTSFESAMDSMIHLYKECISKYQGTPLDLSVFNLLETEELPFI